MLTSVSWKQIINVIKDEGLKMSGKTCKEFRHLRIEDDDASYISHNGLVAISQGWQNYHIWPYMPMISPMLHLLWWGKVVCTSQITILCLEKRSIFLQTRPWMMVRS